MVSAQCIFLQLWSCVNRWRSCVFFKTTRGRALKRRFVASKYTYQWSARIILLILRLVYLEPRDRKQGVTAACASDTPGDSSNIVLDRYYGTVGNTGATKISRDALPRCGCCLQQVKLLHGYLTKPHVKLSLHCDDFSVRLVTHRFEVIFYCFEARRFFFFLKKGRQRVIWLILPVVIRLS